MAINPLPQFEADLAEHLKEKADREAYEKLNAPSTIVVRFGYLRMIGEFPYSGVSKPGCGSKLVVRTHRGTELGEMLTSTCRNSGCSKSVTRKEMLDYIENSGGRQYPFFDRGKVLRIASVDDLNTQEQQKNRQLELRQIAKEMIGEAGLEMSLIEAEPLLGNERVIFYFSSEDRVDFRDLVQDMQRRIGTKVELRQIGARDEARITADYERCGQYCCCKNFLKVLKPVSMKSAKVQKATLDPLKISGRCGRLMCCLRYEDETYDELRKNLPNRKKRVGTPEGDGIVISTQILTQLALIRLDNGTEVAIPVEELTDPEHASAPTHDMSKARASRRSGSQRGQDRNASQSETRADDGKRSKKKKRRRSRSKDQGSNNNSNTSTEAQSNNAESADLSTEKTEPRTTKKKRRRRRRPNKPAGQSGTGSQPRSTDGSTGSAESSGHQGERTQARDRGAPGKNSGKNPGESEQNRERSSQDSNNSDPTKKKRRRRRRRRPNSGGESSGNNSGGPKPTGGSDG